MVRKKKLTSERAAEARTGRRVFTLPIPNVIANKKEKEPMIEKTALYVKTESLFDDRTGFVASSFSDQVLVTNKIGEVLKVIFKQGNVARRYGDGGLENDPTRQQIIVYSMVTCQNHLLWYQRTSPNKQKGEFVGDPRLQGRFSVGFGGHKTREDITISREELIFLKDLLPAVEEEIGTVVGLNKGFFSEVEEEIGISREGIKDLTLLGAFYDKRIEDPLLPVQVGWVHTGIAAVLKVNPLVMSRLVFRASEIAKAWWVPFGKVKQELEKRQENWAKGVGPKVETWTEIMIEEFWKDYTSF